MRCLFATVLVALAALPCSAADAAKPNALTPKESADGWLLLFDGDTAFGWKIVGSAKTEDGVLTLGGEKETTAWATTAFGDYRLAFDYRIAGKAARAEGARFFIENPERRALVGKTYKFYPDMHLSQNAKDWYQGSYEVSTGPKGTTEKGENGEVNQEMHSKDVVSPSQPAFTVPAGIKLSLRNLKLKPSALQPIFNGKDLTGWKEFPERKSKFTVTPEGWLNVKNGPGDLQTEGQWDDFVLQLECISNGKFLNSGIFFRCIAGQYQNGYEVQIQNGFLGTDRTKPLDYGTGAIYRRVAARKVVSNDREWFTLTVVAGGRHIATWVDGFPVVDWTDVRPADANPRKGSKTGKGHLSIQGHDPSTDLSFRNVRIAALPKPAEKKGTEKQEPQKHEDSEKKTEK